MQKALVQLGWLPPGQVIPLQSMPWGLIGVLAWAVPKWREMAEMRYLWFTPHALRQLYPFQSKDLVLTPAFN